MEYTNSEMCRAINEYCHKAKYREVLRLRYCEGLTHEEIAEATKYSVQHSKYICKTYKAILISRF